MKRNEQLYRAWLAGNPVIKGASTVTYQNPVAGAIAPTAAQALLSNLITASVQFSDADTTATITHNLGLTTAQLNAGFPICTFNFSTAGTLAVNYSVTLAANTAIIAKASTSTGSGSTLEVSVMRPWSGMA
jgi:hypothetical protein